MEELTNLPKINEVTIQIVAITMELQNNFECRTELQMYKDFFSLKVCFYKNINNLDVINNICPKADEYYFYAQDNCVCLNLNFYMEG